DAEGSAWLMKAIVERTYTERARSGFFLHDPLAMAVALDDSLIETDSNFVDVSLDGEERGKTVVSLDGHIRVARTIQAEQFLQKFCDAVNIPFVYDAEGTADSE